MERIILLTTQHLLPQLQIESVNPNDPIVIHFIPAPWKVLGAGNYATVVFHPQFPNCVVKVYAPGRPGLNEEVEVYGKLGKGHPAYSECLHTDENYLILRRLKGITLYDCLHLGIPIPKQVIKDVDRALEYARKQGLHPHDVHGKNVMMYNNRGYVVDVSDFYKEEYCSKWSDLKKAYYKFYLPLLYKYPVPIPYVFLDLTRKSYRFYKKYFSRKS